MPLPTTPVLLDTISPRRPDTPHTLFTTRYPLHDTPYTLNVRASTIGIEDNEVSLDHRNQTDGSGVWGASRHVGCRVQGAGCKV